MMLLQFILRESFPKMVLYIFLSELFIVFPDYVPLIPAIRSDVADDRELKTVKTEKKYPSLFL